MTFKKSYLKEVMLRFGEKLYPEKLRIRIMFLSIFLTCISIFSIAYLVEREGIALLLQEKEQKLFTIAHVLDLELGETFEQIDSKLPRDEQIKQLNNKLSPYLEKILQNNPKIAAGYYHRELDAVVVYGPHIKYGDKVGIKISNDHPGRMVMSSGKPLVWQGPQVRGNIMNAMVPIIRSEKIQGYIWTNELAEDISLQAMGLEKRIVLICSLGLISSIVLAWVLSHRMNTDIDIIRQGLKKLPLDLHIPLPNIKGEMNAIVEGINQLALALNESKSTNEMILDSIIDGVVTVDNNGLVTMLNPAAEKIFRYKRGDVIGKPYHSIIDDQNYQSPLLDTLHNGTNHLGIEMDFPVSGRVLHLSLSTSHLKNHNGKIIGAVLVFKDLSEQQEMQRIIQQTERLVAIGELMAGVAHEIRNPLTAIRGFVQYLQKNDISEKHRKEYIDIILKEVDSINEVIRQLLDLSKPHKNYFSPASLNQVIKDTLIVVNTSKYSPAIHFELILDDSLPPVYLDAAMIKQMLLNLIINAIQAISGEGTITIKTYLSEDSHCQYIEIIDTGCGINEDLKDHLFTPFFTTKPSGTGLGLAMVEKIVTSHQGTIQIKNNSNGGAVATVSLPSL
ncbi:MAG: two-component system sensor histidine kinase AtoS [Neisseria animaloris]|uniref:histidine kinase n=1 Tax=Neisseria animaloris TaxID=326522 RepID=A0A448UCX5_9NEIS|nr:two-component system sensor histidine kinase AtoS [Neisseria animaloris]MDO5073714.1 two-component system sensor histidine kinase AtoS [Neisseria animaloris]VEJ21734.1 two-component system sensor kinase [Neisseria animaloris]